MKKYLILLLILAVLLSSCNSGSASSATAAIQTSLAASPLPSRTSPPSPTLLPTYTPRPTSTRIPSSTPTNAVSVTPSATPTRTTTPGPFTFYDDFNSHSGGWEDCEGCTWEDGFLVMGPYEPSADFHVNYCTGCQAWNFYHMAVDVTFLEGEVDRYFGVVFADGTEFMYYLGISPWGFFTVDKWHYEDGHWENLAYQQSNAVNPSYGTNHIEIIVMPAKNPANADYYIYLNRVLVSGIYGNKVEPTWVGLGMNYHAQVAAYDNWEYVVIEP